MSAILCSKLSPVLSERASYLSLKGAGCKMATFVPRALETLRWMGTMVAAGKVLQE